MKKICYCCTLDILELTVGILAILLSPISHHMRTILFALKQTRLKADEVAGTETLRIRHFVAANHVSSGRFLLAEAVFIDCKAAENKLMSNGSMFAHLEKFKSKDFWNEHRTITFNTLTDKQEYEIVAAFRTVVYTDSPEAFKFYRFIDAESANEFDDFIAKCKELSFYDTGVTAEYGDKLITLSTCEYSRNNSRLVVVAKRITEDGGADAAKTHAEATAEGERPN